MMTQIGTFRLSSQFCFLISTFEINDLIAKFCFGIEIALQYNRNNLKLNVFDKAKPRAIVGRKATGPSGIAGLPRSDQRNRITVALLEMVIRFLFK